MPRKTEKNTNVVTINIETARCSLCGKRLHDGSDLEIVGGALAHKGCALSARILASCADEDAELVAFRKRVDVGDVLEEWGFDVDDLFYDDDLRESMDKCPSTAMVAMWIDTSENSGPNRYEHVRSPQADISARMAQEFDEMTGYRPVALLARNFEGSYEWTMFKVRVETRPVVTISWLWPGCARGNGD